MFSANFPEIISENIKLVFVSSCCYVARFRIAAGQVGIHHLVRARASRGWLFLGTGPEEPMAVVSKHPVPKMLPRQSVDGVAGKVLRAQNVYGLVRVARNFQVSKQSMFDFLSSKQRM